MDHGVRICVQYHGRVQGVGFRATCRGLASRHAVTGWVRNESDGGVRLEAQGGTSAVDSFRDAIRAQLGRFIRAEHAHAVPIVPFEDSFEVRS